MSGEKFEPILLSRNVASEIRIDKQALLSGGAAVGTARAAFRAEPLCFWDNTGALHRVTPYSLNSGRLMHRNTLFGEEPLA